MSTFPYDFEEAGTVSPAQPAPPQVDDKTIINEPTLAIGHDVFRDRQRLLEKRCLINILLGALAACLLISTVTLAVLYGLLLRHGHPEPVLPVTTTATTTFTLHHTQHHTTTTTYMRPQPNTTTGTSSRFATGNTEVTTVTASVTNIALSPATPAPTQCWPGSVWGGTELRQVNEDYGVLMSLALSRSGLGRKGLITNYDLVALRSIFLCGQSMEPGSRQLMDVCKSLYISQGSTTRCDEGESLLRDS